MVVKLRTARIRSPSRRAREASDTGGVEGSRTRTRSRTSRSRSPVREATARGRRGPREQPVVADQITEEIPVHADLDDTSDVSIDPRLVAAAPGAPSFMDELVIEDLERVDQAVNELEQIENDVEGEGGDRASEAVQAFPPLPPTPAEVRTRTENRYSIHIFRAFRVCGANRKIAAFLSSEVVTTKGLAELAHGGGSNAEKWITGVAKRLNTGDSTVITPVLTQRVCSLAWYCMDRVRRGITSLQDDEVTLDLLDDCAEHKRGEKRLKEGASAKKEPGKIKLDENWRDWKLSFYSYLRSQPSSRGNSLLYVVADSTFIPRDGDWGDQLAQECVRSGAAFRADSLTVLELLKTVTSGTTSSTLVSEEATCGRTVWLQLVAMHEGTTNATMLLHEGGKLLASTYYSREDAMPFTTFIHKMDRAFTLMSQGSKQELNDLYKTHFVLERLSVEEGSTLAQAKTHCFHQLDLREHYRECVAYLRTAINSKAITSRQKSGKRVVSSVKTKENDTRNKVMTSCNGVSLKNVDKRFTEEEWSKLSSDARKFIWKKRKPFVKRRRVSQVSFSNGTSATEPVASRPPTHAIRQSRVISAVNSSTRRYVYRVSKLHSSIMSKIDTAW